MSEAFSRLDTLLGAEISSAISHIPDAEAVVEDCLEWNKQAFDKWTEDKGFSKERHVRDHFIKVLSDAEEELGRLRAWGDLSRKADLEAAVTFLSRHAPPQQNGAFLRSDSALLLLAKLPPANLMSAMKARTVEDLFYEFTALDILALTRHTESHAWQDAYLDELGKLSSAHFENRPVRFLVVDREFLRDAAEASDHPLKPWSSSHNKETGTITFYTFDSADRIATPNLLLTMLFFHYYFEVLRASRVAHGAGKDASESPGSRFSRMIRSTRRTFSFNNPNIHSEALHWEDAVAYVSAAFPKLAFREYAMHLPCGEFMGDTASEPLSLNLIDHLWDTNLDHGSAYFGRRERAFLYHFRETFWSEILQTLKRLGKDEMRSAVFGQLELDDTAFTEHMLENADTGIEADPAALPWLARER